MAVFSSHRVHYATIVAHFKITRMYIDKCFFLHQNRCGNYLTVAETRSHCVEQSVSSSYHWAVQVETETETESFLWSFPVTWRRLQISGAPTYLLTYSNTKTWLLRLNSIRITVCFLVPSDNDNTRQTDFLTCSWSSVRLHYANHVVWWWW